ncbi:MAG: DUF3616 domain-containing protein [Gammaproteobacteria bacterium]|nr:DUF3616 domain-containing protein [Gammaproteobacteria bacterium]
MISIGAGFFFGLAASLAANASDFDWQPLVSDDGAPAVCEPSAVRQLADGRLLLVQDEASDPLVLLQFNQSEKSITLRRPVLEERERPFWILGRAEPPRGLEDLEGLAAGADDFLYAITSHSHTLSGMRQKTRERLVRLRIEGERIRDYAVFGKLRKAILSAHPELKKAARSGYDKGRKGFNIEGLCADRERRRLFIGLRSPILDGQSMVLIMENPAAVFEKNEKPVFASTPLRLDLDKGGIRAMSYVPWLGRYLLVTQKAKKKGTSDRPFRLWLWGGPGDAAPRPLKIPDLDLRSTEGITPVRLGGDDYLLLVSDDGNRRRNRAGHYLLVPREALNSALQAE